MTILEKVNDAIADVKPKTIHGDLTRVAKMAGITVPVACNYSLGKGVNAETAIKVLKAMKEIVNQREKAIA